MRKYSFNPGIMSGGLNNCDDDTIIENKQFSDCQNIVFDKDNYPQKRPPVITGIDSVTNLPNWKTGIEVLGKTKRSQKLYTYQKRDGSEYVIAYAGGQIYSSQDMVTWVLRLSGLNENYLPAFTTFKDKLIISNGFDEMYYWDGAMTLAQKLCGAVLALSASGSTVENGVHKFKITYTTSSVTYAYDVVTQITVTGNKDILVSGIPLGIDASDLERKIWVTKAGEEDYYLAETFAAGSAATSFTFNTADADLTVAYDGTNVISVQPPKSRFLEVYDNRLFAGHSLDAPSEVNWTDPENFEDFLIDNVTAVNVDDGEYITGLKTYKAFNQLICFKKNGLFVLYPSNDTYLYRSMSYQGCTLDGSIQEFHVEDEHVSRDSIIYANSVGVWEYDGHTVRQISRQPKGSTITNTWRNVKQRKADYKKNIKTTKADFDPGINATRLNNDLTPNWMEATIANDIGITNVFNWFDTSRLEGADCYCWDSHNKRIWISLGTGGGNGKLGYYEWDDTNKEWSTVTYTIDTVTTYGNTVKMEYDSVTDRIYGITSIGAIWRTQTGSHVSPYSEDSANSKTFDITSMSGTSTILSTFSGTQLYIPIRADYTVTYTPRYAGQDVYIVDAVTDVGTQFASSGTTHTLKPGIYYAVANGAGNTTQPITITYTRVGNIDMKIYNGLLYYISHEQETTTTYPIYTNRPKKVLKSIDLSTWASAVTVGNIGRSYSYFGNTIAYSSYSAPTISYSDETVGFTSHVSSIIGLNDEVTTTTTYEILRHSMKSPVEGILEACNVSDGKYYIGRATSNTLTSAISINYGSELTIYNTTNKNIPLIYNSTKNKWYYIDNGTMTFKEATNTSDTVVDLDLPNSATGYLAIVYCTGVSTGTPDMILAKPATGSAYWRGVVGNYTMKGNWLITGANVVDTSADGSELLTYEGDQLNAENGTIKKYLVATTNSTLTAYTPFVEVEFGQKLQGMDGLSIDGITRYIHQRVEIEYDINASLLSSDNGSWKSPSSESLILNWIEVEGGTTIPKTYITSAVVNNYYYLAFCELVGTSTSEPNANVNNCIVILDRYKRWAIWRGDAIYPASMTVFKDKLYWSDSRCIDGDVDWQSDYIYYLGERNSNANQFTDMYVNTDSGVVDLQAIDAFYITKNFSELAQYDSIMQKKDDRMMYITALRYPALSKATYSLLIGHNVDEVKDANGIDIYTEQAVNLIATDIGKTTKRITFGNGETLGYRRRYRFRNNVIGEDLAMIQFQTNGFIYHARWTE